MSYADFWVFWLKTTQTTKLRILSGVFRSEIPIEDHRHLYCLGWALAMFEPPSNPRRAALTIALLADALQIALFPLFAEGALSPLDDLLDIAVAWMLIRLLGWHWAFVPTFVAELVPGLDLVPTWTIAVLVVTREMPEEHSATEPPTIEGRL